MVIVNKEIVIKQTVNGLQIDLKNNRTEHTATSECISSSWYVKRSDDNQWTGAFKSSESAIKFITSK